MYISDASHRGPPPDTRRTAVTAAPARLRRMGRFTPPPWMTFPATGTDGDPDGALCRSGFRGLERGRDLDEGVGCGRPRRRARPTPATGSSTGRWTSHTSSAAARTRGFAVVNACRHRGNVPAREARGNAKRPLCQYHLWSYDLAGNLKGCSGEAFRWTHRQGHPRPGSRFLPTPSAGPSSSIRTPMPRPWPSSSARGRHHAGPYHLDEMTTVMDVTEAIDCNWKARHGRLPGGLFAIDGIHPRQLLRVINIDPGYHPVQVLSKSTVVQWLRSTSSARARRHRSTGVMDLPETFLSTVAVLPRFTEPCRRVPGCQDDEGGAPTFPEGVTARTLLQRARHRDTLTGMGLTSAV